MLPDDNERKLKLYYMSGGNFLETMPDPDFVAEALANLEIRVHQDIILNTSTLLDAKETVIVLPAKTRYEQDGGGLSTSTERMIYFSPEIEGNRNRIKEARSEWQIYVDLARRVKPDEAHLVGFSSGQEIREEIAKANPQYDGVQHLKNSGDVYQYGGAWLCEDGNCPTPDGRANLISIDIPDNNRKSGEFKLLMRRGKQFNSMVYGDHDAFNEMGRYDALISEEDARSQGIQEGEPVVIYNVNGVFQGFARLADIKPGNIGIQFPEGNYLVPKGIYENFAEMPDYTVDVKLEKADHFNANKDRQYYEKPVADLEDNPN